MNFRRTFALIVLFFLLPIFGSCTTGGSYLFPPAYSMSIVNNLKDVSIDIEWNGEMQRKGLLPGETHKFELWSLRARGMQFSFVAKVYQGSKYIGMASRVGFVGYDHFTHEVWEIRSLSAPGDVITNRGP